MVNFHLFVLLYEILILINLPTHNNMNTNRLLLGTLVGIFGYFIAGGLLYTVVFKNLLASTNPGMASVQSDPSILALIVGNLSAGLLLAYIFEKWAGIKTLASGAVSGALISCLMALSYDSMIHGTTNLMSWGGVFMDVIVFSLCGAVAGAFAGFTLGYKRAL
jgi:hypothetical protein